MNAKLMQALRGGIADIAMTGPKWDSTGLCDNLELAVEERGFFGGVAYDVVAAAAHTWEYTVRDEQGKPKDYFVPHCHGEELWEGVNLELREDLMRHVLNWLSSLEEFAERVGLEALVLAHDSEGEV